MIGFLLQLILIGGGLLLLARFMRVFPNRMLVLMIMLPTVVAVGLLIPTSVISLPSIDIDVQGVKTALPVLLLVVIGLDALVAVIALVDLKRLPAQSAFSITRQMSRVASLKKNHRVELTLTNSSGSEHVVRVRDGAPHELAPDPQEHYLRLPARSRTTVHYEIQAARRGAFLLKAIHLRVTSPLRLWQRFFDFPQEQALHVYPDMKQLSEYALLARTNRLSLMGVRRVRKIGQDNEFERLRDYARDDNFKHIDWRSTARRRKLTVKDYQRNQSQRLLFLIDCGRMMTNEAAGISLLDHALNSALMLSYVALSQGDAVGLLCFSDQIHNYVPPKTGMAQMNRLLHASFDRFPSLVESRYDRAFLYLNNHCRKRSLVILVTNIIDEVNSHQVQQYLTNIVGKHLPLTVLMRDRRLFEAADMPHPHGQDLYRAAAAADILSWRHQVLTDLTSRGVLSVDVFPEELTAPLVNRYLDIKARHLL